MGADLYLLKGHLLLDPLDKCFDVGVDFGLVRHLIGVVMVC